MPQFSFGSGFLYGIPSGANPSPVLFGTLQDVTIDITYAIKKLMGQYQAPVAVARAAATYTGKAKAASISSAIYNSIFAGVPDAVGGVQVVNAESFSPAATTYTVSTSPTTMQDDLGVTYAATNLSLKRVAAAPTVGQYAVNTATGVYTFNTGDNGVAMFVSYSYTSTTLGRSITYANQLMGSAPSFSLVLNVPFNQFGTSLTYKFFNAISTKLAFDFKNEDFTVPQFDFECYANAAGNVYSATFSS